MKKIVTAFLLTLTANANADSDGSKINLSLDGVKYETLEEIAIGEEGVIYSLTSSDCNLPLNNPKNANNLVVKILHHAPQQDEIAKDYLLEEAMCADVLNLAGDVVSLEDHTVDCWHPDSDNRVIFKKKIEGFDFEEWFDRSYKNSEGFEEANNAFIDFFIKLVHSRLIFKYLNNTTNMIFNLSEKVWFVIGAETLLKEDYIPSNELTYYIEKFGKKFPVFRKANSEIHLSQFRELENQGRYAGALEYNLQMFKGQIFRLPSQNKKDFCKAIDDEFNTKDINIFSSLCCFN